MEQLIDQHHMFHKLSTINALAAFAPLQVIKQAFNKWDDELTEQMKCAERNGCKLYRGKCEYSPILSYWYGRKRLWERARRHKLDPLRDPRNLYQDLQLHGFPKPSSVTLEFLDARIQACVQELLSLEAKATALCRQHLRERLKIAKQNNDTEAIKAISRIIRKECQRRVWSTTNYAIKGPRMRSVCTIQVSEDVTTHEFTNKKSLEEN